MKKQTTIKLKLLLTTTLCLLLLAALAQAQTGRRVRGIVKDTTGMTVPGAVVKITSPTDSLLTSTDANGVYVFNGVKGKQVWLTVTSIGYQGIRRKYALSADNQPAVLGTVKLLPESKMLGVVNIVQSNAIKVKTDTTEYKASAYPVEANAPVEDVVKKLPGVDVDKDGNITAEGKSVTKVRVNGKDFFGGDVKTATKNLPADMIESIQMVDDYGDQANLTGIKSGEPTKIMNIVIRKDKNYGFSLSATGGDGADALPSAPGISNDNRYVGSINGFKFNGDQQIALLGGINNTNVNLFSFGSGNGGFGGGGGGGRGNGLRGSSSTTGSNGITLNKSIGLNFRDQWGKNLAVYGSYSFNDNTVNTISQTQQFNSVASADAANPSSRTQYQNSNETDGNLNHRLTWNMEYKPDTLNFFKLSPTFSYSSTTTNLNELVNISLDNVVKSAYTAKTQSTSTSPSYGAELLYNHRFNGHGRNLSFDINANTSNTDQFQNPTYQYTTGAAIAPKNQLITNNNRTNTFSVNTSYIEPLSKRSYLEISHTYSYSYTNNNKVTDTVTTANVENNVDSLSKNYHYTFVTNKFGLNYKFIEKNYNLTLGLGVQPGSLDGTSQKTGRTTRVNTLNWVPNVRYTYNFSRSQAININYNGSSNQPSYSQLDPTIDYSNASYPTQGNPLLKPEFNNNISVRYNKFDFTTGNVLFTNLSFTQTDDKITTNSITYNYPKGYTGSTSLAGITSVKYRNSNGYYNANGFIAFAKPWLQRKYTLMFRGNVSYTNSTTYLSSVTVGSTDTLTLQNTVKNLSVGPGVRFRVSFTNIIDAELNSGYSLNYTTNSVPQVNGTTNYKTITLGLNGKNYFDNSKWTLYYDFTKSINQGYVNATNPNILNMYVEHKFLANNMASLRASVFDIFNQNTGFTSTANSSTSVNRLGRYYLLTLTIRLQKFAGKNPMQQQPGMPGSRYGGGPGGPPPGGGGPGMSE